MSDFQQLITQSRAQLVELVGTRARGAQDLLDRFDRWAHDMVQGLSGAYDLEVVLPALIEVMARNHKARDAELQQRDRERVLNPDWFQRPDTIGYVCYTDLFEKDLKGLNTRIGYLKRLGVSYLHLMPILKPRPGANDGGYAVMDYRSLREDLGTMQELRKTASDLHAAGISLTLDLVLNHVALEHEWAEKAKQGDQKYRDYFYIYPDRNMPDQFEQNLPEVFPDFSPGNFTWNDQLGAWVWTTFNSYQWDVNWSNPNVFCEFADIIGNLANHGVDCLRLDAIAFIWKRLGTNCQNQDEVHSITEALRMFVRILSPSLIFKAEAIVGPAQVGAYLGEGHRSGKVSDMAYHNSLMVQIWGAIASKDARLMELAMSRFQALPNNTAWGVYLRCHDDIGWAIDDSDAGRLGFSGHDHRMFLADYFTGRFYGSDAKGVDFQTDAVSGERRTSGTAASLAGIELAQESGDPKRLQRAVDRYICAYSMVFGFGGIPLIYMGDEIGLFNDEGYVADPAKAEDNRWLHRPSMDWDTALAAAAGELGHTVPGQIRDRMQRLIDTRKRLDSLHAGVATQVRSGRGLGVAIFDRKHPAGNLIQLYNLSDGNRFVNTDELGGMWGEVVDELTGHHIWLNEGLPMAPYEVRWLRKL
jgi:amylosucrase